MESLLIELIQEARQANQLLTELNDNVIALINALAEGEPEELPPRDLDGNPI